MQSQNNKIRTYTFTVLVGTSRVMRLNEANSVLDSAVITHLRTRRFGATRKSLLGKAIVNNANFESAFLVIKSGQTVLLDQLMFEHVEQATVQVGAKGLEVNLANVDWNQSKIEVPEGVALDTGAVFELTVTYYNP